MWLQSVGQLKRGAWPGNEAGAAEAQNDTITHVETIAGVCSVFPPTTLSLRTKLLLKLVCLVSKLQQPEEELRLDGLQTVVCLLECLQGFPELAGRKKSLQSFRAEAMCQVGRGVWPMCQVERGCGPCVRWGGGVWPMCQVGRGCGPCVRWGGGVAHVSGGEGVWPMCQVGRGGVAHVSGGKRGCGPCVRRGEGVAQGKIHIINHIWDIATCP